MESSRSHRWTLTIGLIVAGTASYYMASFQNSQKVIDVEMCPAPSSWDAEPKTRFFHPYIQTFLMFFGEFLCLVYVTIAKKRDSRQFLLREDLAKLSGKHKPKLYQYIVPAAFDLISAILQYIAIGMISGSTFQFMRSGALIFTALFSKLLTKTAFKKHQKWGCGIALLGVLIVALSELLRGLIDNPNKDIDYWMGGVFMVASVCFAGLFYAYEQLLFQKYYIEPYTLVGMEGVYGMIMMLGVIAAASYIPCPWRQVSCNCVNYEMFVESPQSYFREISENSLLVLFAILMSLSVGVVNIVGVNVTKYINAVGRSILDSARGILVWVIGLILTSLQLFGREYQSFKWYVLLCKVVGLMTLIFATLVYNQLIFVQKLSERDTLQASSSFLEQSM